MVPYYIADERPGCKSGWAVVKENGSVVACHETKEKATRQMVALSIDEGIEPGGEWREED